MKSAHKFRQIEDVMKPTIYEAMKAAGVPIDSHESDLYVRATPEAERIISEYGKVGEYFTDSIDHVRWIELPFMFDPFWKKAIP